MPVVDSFWTLHLYDIAGVAGFGCYVIAYTCLTFGILTQANVRYFMINLTAASLVMLSLWGAFNLATMMIQSFWIVLSVIAITRRVRARREAEVTFAALHRRTTGTVQDTSRVGLRLVA